MKLIYNAILFLFLNTVFAQESNIFLARDFWQTSPTIDQVKAEIEKGNSPTEKNANAFDATVYAIISHAPTETIKYLLTLPENPLDKNTHDGRNYLLWAGYAGDFELVKHLIELGSDIKWKDDHGFDLVTFTASGGNLNPDLYELYKSVGFNISESKRNGANALLLVAPNALEIKELDYFVKNGMPLNSEDDNGNTIFHAVAAKGNVPILQNLIEAGVDAKKLNNNNENALFSAARGVRRHSNGIEVFKFLIENYLNPLQENSKGENLMHVLAANNPNVEIAELLVGKGLNPQKSDAKGNIPYYFALKTGDAKMQDYFLESLQNVNHKNADGESLISVATEKSNLIQFTKLVAKDSKISETNADNETLVNILFNGYDIRKKSEFNQILQVLNQSKLSPKINSKTGNNLYHIAVNKGDLHVLDQAQNFQQDINLKNAEGLSPLHLAAMKSTDLELMKKLLEFGANPAIETEFGETAKMLAIENELLLVEEKDLNFLN